MKKIITFVLFGITASTFAFAHQPATSGAAKEVEVEQKQEANKQRIEAGAQSGQLTEIEKAKLEKKEAGIKEEKAQAKEDGPGITKGEADKLDRMQERNAERITKQKTDKQTN